MSGSDRNSVEFSDKLAERRIAISAHLLDNKTYVLSDGVHIQILSKRRTVLFFGPGDMSADTGELSFDVFIPPIEVVDTVDDTAAFGGHGTQHECSPGP